LAEEDRPESASAILARIEAYLADAAPDIDVDSPRFRPWTEASPSTGPIVCQFLATVGPKGQLSAATTTALPTHRCAAFGDPLPLSLRQQELVCLQRVHVSCPRYARGMLLGQQADADAKPAGRSNPQGPISLVSAFRTALGHLGRRKGIHRATYPPARFERDRGPEPTVEIPVDLGQQIVAKGGLPSRLRDVTDRIEAGRRSEKP
jgi:hypothetical protein